MLCESELIEAADVDAVLPVERLNRKPFVLQESDDPTLSGLQKRQIIEVFSRASSRREAAAMLGISTTTLWRKCKEFGLN